MHHLCLCESLLFGNAPVWILLYSCCFFLMLFSGITLCQPYGNQHFLVLFAWLAEKLSTSCLYYFHPYYLNYCMIISRYLLYFNNFFSCPVHYVSILYVPEVVGSISCSCAIAE